MISADLLKLEEADPAGTIVHYKIQIDRPTRSNMHNIKIGIGTYSISKLKE